jgi:hypothetical protein
MSDVQALDQAMIEAYLQHKEVIFLVDQDGDYRVGYTHDPEIGGALTIWLIRAGHQREIFCVRVTSDRHIPQWAWGKAVLLCNQWNADRRWPKAYLHYQASDAEFGEIIMEGQFDLEEGIHTELFTSFTDTTVSASYQFWKWAHQEQGL